MCLLSINRVPSIAREDMYVFKVVNEVRERYYTPYIFKEVPANGKLKAEGRIMRRRASIFYAIDGGMIHSYLTREAAKSICWRSDRRKVFEAIIPKGTKYYMGMNSDICSKELNINIGKEV